MSFLGKGGSAGSEMKLKAAGDNTRQCLGCAAHEVSSVLCNVYSGSKLELQLFPTAWSTGYPAGISDLEISFSCWAHHKSSRDVCYLLSGGASS